MSSELDEKKKLALADADESAPLVADQDDNETDSPTRRARFEREHQPPSPWKRAALILFIFALLWFAARLRAQSRPGKPAVVHAERCVAFSMYPSGRRALLVLHRCIARAVAAHCGSHALLFPDAGGQAVELVVTVVLAVRRFTCRAAASASEVLF